MTNNRGMVLVSVLWVILILTLVSFSLAAAVRVEMEAAQQSFDGDRALVMAKGAADVVFNIYSKEQGLPSDSPIRRENGVYIVPFDSGQAEVRLESDSGLININTASDKVLASLFDSLGVDQEKRNRLVDCILDWRDPDDIPHLYGAEVDDYPENVPGKPAMRPRNADFQTVEEVLMVKNMTPEIFYGSFSQDPVSGEFRRVPALKDLITVRTRGDKVNVNLATFDVLAALPSMTPDLANAIIAERTKSHLGSAEDLLTRVPRLVGADAVDYFSFDPPQPTALVSRAVIPATGISKTVRLLFKRESKIQVITYSPYVYRMTNIAVPDRWRID